MITFEQAQPYIFAGESGGDYNALFNYQNRKDGLFSDIKLTEMTLDEVLDFTNPRGAYANYVGLNNKGTISTPVGAYQVVGRTLRQAKEDLNLSGDEKFSKSLQDKIGRYIFNTQGVDAWEGYKGPRGQEEIKSMAVPNNQTMNTSAGTATPLLQNMMQGKPRGIMDFLRDPRTRMALASLSRGQIGQNQRVLAQADLNRMQTKNIANRTAAYLRTQEGGEPYAQAIDAGMDPKAVYNSFIGQMSNTSRVQQGKQLPDGSGYSFLMADGTVGVRLIDNTVLTGELARRYLAASTARKADIDRRTAGAKSLGKDEIDEAREAQSKLDTAQLKANTAINRAQAIIDNPNLANVTGRVNGALPFYTEDNNDLVILISQFKDTLGVQAFDSLRGAGAITEPELVMATKALIDLNRTQSTRQFLSQMNEIKQYLSDGFAIAEKKAQRLSELLQGNTENYEPVPPIDVEALKAEIAGTSNVTSPQNPDTTQNVTETVID